MRAGIDGEERDLLDHVADGRPANNPEKELLRRELRASILCALKHLTPQERVVFDMEHFQGMKLRAVGEILNTSEGSVKTSLVRGMRKLRLHLGRHTSSEVINKEAPPSGGRASNRDRSKVARNMRVISTAVVISALSLSRVFARATGLAESSTVLAALQAKADQAERRDKCLLYAEVVNHMTDVAGRQLNSGDSVQASKTIELIRGYAVKIHKDTADDSRKLTNVELLIERTASRISSTKLLMKADRH